VPRIHFQQQLAELKDKLLAMAALAQLAVESAVDAYLQRDKGLCQYVKQNETAINTAQRELDEMAYELLAKEQPMAIDLRFILAVIKINNDLERMGDLAVNITERALTLMREPAVKPLIDIPRIADLAESMVHRALDAFAKHDAEMARDVLLSDDAVDRLRDAVYDELLSFMQEERSTINRAVSLMFIAQNLERIADHSTNIAEDVLFAVKGIDVRHHAETVE